MSESLTGYAERTGGITRTQTFPEWLEENPEVLQEIEEGRNNGVTWETIVRWLRMEHKQSVGISTVRRALTEAQLVD